MSGIVEKNIKVVFNNPKFAGRTIVVTAMAGSIFALINCSLLEKNKDLLDDIDDELNPVVKRLGLDLQDALYDKLSDEFMKDIDRDTTEWVYVTNSSERTELTDIETLAFAEDIH